MGQKLLAIAQIVDEMYDAVVNQQDVLLGGHYILPDRADTVQEVRGRLLTRAPGRKQCVTVCRENCAISQ
ncbi:hypothetical protein NX696_004813 [Escherichia coli]|nr:hypothetical protein [Escherichia coli]